MAAPDPIGDLIAFIVSLGPYAVTSDSATPSVTLALDTNAFRGPLRPVRNEVPPLSVFVDNAGGQPPHPSLGTGKNERRFLLVVVVRSDTPQNGGRTTGEELARNIMFAIQAPSSPPSGYLTCLCQQPTPEPFDEDDERLVAFRFFVELWHYA